MRRDLVKALKAIGETQVALGTDGRAVLTSPSKSTKRTIEAHIVANLVSEGLLERVRGKVKRTDAGRAFLRRALAAAADDPFEAQHQTVTQRVVTCAETTCTVRANASESPLAWLAQRRGKDGRPMIEPTQFEAGSRLGADYARGHQRERITQSWNASAVRSTARRDGLAVTEAAEDARRRFAAAIAQVGPELARVLVAVCCEEKGLEAVEKSEGWPPRSGKVVLRLALDRLAAHYGIGTLARGNARASMVHWGAPDYVPSA